MRKKILIGIGVFVLIIAAAIIYLNNRNRTLSPPGEVTGVYEELVVKVDYSRPSVRDRVIFGTGAAGALVPYGAYWRLGANEPTKLTINQDFKFGGQTVTAGTYDMYAVPQEGEIKLVLNSGDRFWGFSEPDYDEDIIDITVPMQESKISVEQFTISAVGENGGVNLIFMWSDKIWEVLITGA